MIALASRATRRLTVFGGSFNPPHRGHEGLVEMLLDLALSDEVQVVPVFEHPFGKALAPFADRMAMCRLAFARFGDRVVVSEIEARLGGPSYTVRTLERLRTEHPDDELQLVVGADTLKDTSGWRDFDRVRTLARLLVVPREGESAAEAMAVPPPPGISSSEVRRRLAMGESVEGMLSPEVAAYAAARGLYRPSAPPSATPSATPPAASPEPQNQSEPQIQPQNSNNHRHANGTANGTLKPTEG